MQNICLTEESFLNKITTGCFWNLSFLHFLHLISNFTDKDTIFWNISRSCYGIFLKRSCRSNRTQVFLKKVFSKCWRNLQDNNHTEIQLQMIGCNLANMPRDISPKNCLRKLCVWRPGRHMYVICMSISHMFSSGMKLRVRKFSDLIEFS